ncbi:Hypothetical protein NTJ_10359 [Nesidiocoris tenuis]|uniref:F5/8 type C domain-containing protein n=1 Tax=Nesidiocoris tenuis TaxID=355587 RepID=A0ABN7B1U7_9HEMI|nr:Hypothetical protein NTJ_10359 [Nesidiocoris tenuis]
MDFSKASWRSAFVQEAYISTNHGEFWRAIATESSKATGTLVHWELWNVWSWPTRSSWLLPPKDNRKHAVEHVKRRTFAGNQMMALWHQASASKFSAQSFKDATLFLMIDDTRNGLPKTLCQYAVSLELSARTNH